MESTLLTKEHVVEILGQVLDPEVPALSIVDLGILRDVLVLGSSHVQVVVTPTYSGCPAMDLIRSQIELRLRDAGIETVTVRTVYNPPWSTDWMSETAKQKLKGYGIAPPQRTEQGPLIQIRRKEPEIVCPFCDSAKTKRTSEFGSTACKALYFCAGCNQPFEYFKAF